METTRPCRSAGAHAARTLERLPMASYGFPWETREIRARVHRRRAPGLVQCMASHHASLADDFITPADLRRKLRRGKNWDLTRVPENLASRWTHRICSALSSASSAVDDVLIIRRSTFRSPGACGAAASAACWRRLVIRLDLASQSDSSAARRSSVSARVSALRTLLRTPSPWLGAPDSKARRILSSSASSSISWRSAERLPTSVRLSAASRSRRTVEWNSVSRIPTS